MNAWFLINLLLLFKIFFGCRSCLQMFTSVWRGSLFQLINLSYVRDVQYWLPCLLETSRSAVQRRYENAKFRYWHCWFFYKNMLQSWLQMSIYYDYCIYSPLFATNLSIQISPMECPIFYDHNKIMIVNIPFIIQPHPFISFFSLLFYFWCSQNVPSRLIPMFSNTFYFSFWKLAYLQIIWTLLTFTSYLYLFTPLITPHPWINQSRCPKPKFIPAIKNSAKHN